MPALAFWIAAGTLYSAAYIAPWFDLWRASWRDVWDDGSAYRGRHRDGSDE